MSAEVGKVRQIRRRAAQLRQASRHLRLEALATLSRARQLLEHDTARREAGPPRPRQVAVELTHGSEVEKPLAGDADG